MHAWLFKDICTSCYESNDAYLIIISAKWSETIHVRKATLLIAQIVIRGNFRIISLKLIPRRISIVTYADNSLGNQVKTHPLILFKADKYSLDAITPICVRDSQFNDSMNFQAITKFEKIKWGRSEARLNLTGFQIPIHLVLSFPPDGKG